MDMRFGTWNVTSMYRAVAEEISKYKLDLVGVQVTWDAHLNFLEFVAVVVYKY
jgi:hypothetical protein